MPEYTTITLEDENGKYSISVPCEEVLTMEQMIERLIKPMLLAAGYSNETVNEHLGER